MKIKANKIKVGEEYFFPDNNFTYVSLFKVEIRKERINKIIGREFSTKNVEDRYEKERVIGFETELEARKYLIKQIKDRKKSIDEEYKTALDNLAEPV